MSLSERDTTLQTRHPGIGMCTKTLFMCGHKGGMEGSHHRHIGGRARVPMLCSACNEARKAEKVAA